jgi:hypothetical protein
MLAVRQVAVRRVFRRALALAGQAVLQKRITSRAVLPLLGETQWLGREARAARIRIVPLPATRPLPLEGTGPLRLAVMRPQALVFWEYGLATTGSSVSP